MAFFRTLHALFSSRACSVNCSFFSAFTIPQIPTPPSLSLPRHSSLISPRSRLLFPLSPWELPFSGPLFLSYPPWKLSQSATPLYIQYDALLLSNFKGFRFKLRSPSSINHLLNCAPPEEFPTPHISSDFVNSPNLISMARLISGPLIAWMITNEWYLSSFIGLVISGASDWLDGYVARRMKIDSVVGSYLDPLADKVLIGCVALAMVHQNLLNAGLVGIVVIRDVILIVGALYKRGSSIGWNLNSWHDFFNLDGTSPQKIKPLIISKVNTVLQLALVAAALLQPNLGTEDTESYITYLSWAVGSTTVASTAAYGMQNMRIRAMAISRNC